MSFWGSEPQSRPLSADAHVLRVSIRSGEILVRSADVAQITGTLTGRDLDQVRVTTTGGRLAIDSRRLRTDLTVDVEVPFGTELDLSTGSADVVVRGEVGPVQVASGSGDVDLQDCASLSAQTGSGDVQADTVHGPIRVATGSGDVVLGEVHGPAQSRSGSGDFRATEQHGPVDVTTASGDIRVQSSWSDVKARTASGDVVVGLRAEHPTLLDLHSLTGEVVVDLDQSTPPTEGEQHVTVHARTVSGDVRLFRAGS